MQEEAKLEYIKALIKNLESSKRYVLLYISFDLGLLVLLLNGILFQKATVLSTGLEKTLLCLIVLALISSASFLSNWISRLHALAIEAVDLFVTSELDAARKKHYPGGEYWNRWRWIYWSGIIAMIIAIALASILVVMKLLGIT